MPDYEIAKPDLDKVDPDKDGRPGVSFGNNLMKEDTAAQVAFYLRSHGFKTPEQVETLFEQMKAHALNMESSALGKIFGMLYWEVIKKNVEFTPKQIVWILTNFDKLVLITPPGFLTHAVLFIDKIAEQIYENM